MLVTRGKPACMETKLELAIHAGTAKSVRTCLAECGGSGPASQTQWVSVGVAGVVSVRVISVDAVLGTVCLVKVARAVPLVTQVQVYAAAGVTAIHICVVVIVLGRVVEVVVAVIYKSVCGAILVPDLVEQLVAVLHKRMCQIIICVYL